MTLSYEEATAQLTAPGERYEIEEVEVRGVTYTAFKSAPGTLREIFDLTRGYGATPFLVYEDETYTFDEVYAAADGSLSRTATRARPTPERRSLLAMSTIVTSAARQTR